MDRTQPDHPTCDWRVVLVDGAGARTVRGPEDACCSWTLTVHDLDPVADPFVHELDQLRWSGGDTCVTPGRATTPLHRETGRRQTTTAPDHVEAELVWSRRLDEVVTTNGPGGTAPTVANGAHAQAAAVWARHLDVLRERGARPDPVDEADGPPADPIEAARRVAVDLRPETACPGVPDHADVVGTCEVVLTTRRDQDTPMPPAHRLAAWVEVGASTVVADRPLGPMATNADLVWSRLTGDEGAGVAVESVPAGDHTIRWRGAVDVSVPTDEVSVVLGHAVRLDPHDRGGSAGHVQVHATAATRLRLAVDRAAHEGCRCTTAHLVVEVGDGGAVLRVDGLDVPITFA